MIEILRIAAASVWIFNLAVTLSWIVGREGRSTGLMDFVYEVRWVYLWVTVPLDVLNDLVFRDDNIVMRALGITVSVYFWVKIYHDKDDRWKKRRKRAAGRVKEVAGKLVVVPDPPPSPA